MAADETAHVGHSERSLGARTVLAITGAAILVGLGLASTAYWLITGEWAFFGGVAAVVVGGLLLFSRLSGPDRA